MPCCAKYSRGADDLTLAAMTTGSWTFAYVNQTKQVRRLFFLLMFLLLAFFVIMSVAVYLVIAFSKEMHVQHGKLVDNDGKGISTLIGAGNIHGVEPADERRLALMNITSAAGTGNMMMEGSSFAATQEHFHAGVVDWIVVMPDGAVRTVQIQGMGPSHAWGLCGSCSGKVLWRATCANDMSDCAIEWSAGVDERRLAGRSEWDSHFLARAGRAPHGDDSKVSMERSLGDKTCM